MSDDLVKRLQSLHKQATVERSHFYVGSCAKDAMHRIEELEAKLKAKEKRFLALAGDKGKLAKVESFVRDVASRATTVEHDQDEMWLLDFGALRHERDCDITQARTILAELSKERSDEKGQDDECTKQNL